MAEVILKDVRKVYDKDVVAVDSANIEIQDKEFVVLVGPSGCGKSTTAKATIQLPRPTDGSVWFKGQDITKFSAEQLRRVRPEFQMIFQDPISSLNPRRKIRDVISEGIAVWGNTKGSWSQERIEELMVAVGIDRSPGLARTGRPYSARRSARRAASRL